MSRSCIRAQIVIVTILQQGSSLCNMLLRGMKDDSGKANEQDSDVFHHDEGRKRQDDFSVDPPPPSQNALFQHCRRAMFQASVWTTAHDSAMIESDPCFHGSNREHDHLIPEWITIPEVAAMCKELVGQMWMPKNHVQVSAAAVNMP